jgi:hypothetical protein
MAVNNRRWVVMPVNMRRRHAGSQCAAQDCAARADRYGRSRKKGASMDLAVISLLLLLYLAGLAFVVSVGG